jgi:hypothetical protein
MQSIYIKPSILERYSRQPALTPTKEAAEILIGYAGTKLIDLAKIADVTLSAATHLPTVERYLIFQELIYGSKHIRDYVLLCLMKDDDNDRVETLVDIARSSQDDVQPRIYGLASAALLCTNISSLPAWVMAYQAPNDSLAQLTLACIAEQDEAFNNKTLKKAVLDTEDLIMQKLGAE